MKIFNKKKIGQSLLEFALIGALVGIVGGWSFIQMNPDLFRNYFKGSVSSSNLDSNGQMKLCAYDDETCYPSSSSTSGCDPIVIGDIEADGTIYTGNASGNDLCTTPAADEDIKTWNSGGGPNIVTGANNATYGKPNTTTLNTLVNAASPYKAAQYCAGLNVGGHNDWYLPSQVELSIIYVERAAIGGFTNTQYWSSTEFSGEKAYIVDFSSFGAVTGKNKDNNKRIRCVRHD